VTRLATTIVVLTEGRVAAVGPTAEIMSRIDLLPLTGRAEAGAILNTRISGHDPAFGLTRLRAAAGELRVPSLDLPVGAALRVRIRARDVMIALEPPQGLSALNILPGTVAEIGPADGASVEMRLDCASEPLLARLTRRSVENLGLVPGRQVYAVIKSIAFDHQAFAGAVPALPGADAQTRPAGDGSVDLQQFDIENQRRVRRDDAAGAARAVAEFGRDHERALAADLHAGDTLVPALDDLAAAEREAEWLAAVERAVELLAFLALIVEPAGI